MNNDRCPVREAEIIHNSRPDAEPRLLHVREQMISEKAEELYHGWISGGDNWPEELWEALAVNGLGEILGDMLGGDNPQTTGYKLDELTRKTLEQIAVLRAEEWELEQ